MVKAKKKKMAKKEGTRNVFLNGGFYMFMLAGFIGILFGTLYFLITVETQKQMEEVSYNIFRPLFLELGMLLFYLGLIVACYALLKKEEPLKKISGSFFVSSSVLIAGAIVYSAYLMVTPLKDQSLTVKAFITTTVPELLQSMGRLYFLLGALCVGIFLWGQARRRRWAAGFFVGGASISIPAMGIFMYSVYDGYKMFIGMYPTSRAMIISQYVVPQVLEQVAEILVVLGVLLYAASYLWTHFGLGKWGGSSLFFGGCLGVFNGFIRLGMTSEGIHSELTSARQSLMDLQPYSTTLKELSLTLDTMKEFYVKKMAPVYLESSLIIVVFTGIALIGLYFWMKKQ